VNQCRAHVLVCAGAGCVSSGCQAVQQALVQSVRELGLESEVRIVETGCMGPCDMGPIIVVYPEGIFYQKVTPEGAGRIAQEHLLKGRLVDSLIYRQAPDQPVPHIGDIEFFAKQTRVALRNTGIIDPEAIDEYIARDGYAALGKVLSTMTRQDVVAEVKKSGLRGRGGGGFPTGLKWEFTARSNKSPKYVVCNADEGDPGAFMDRSILEGDPHSVIEAMVIAGYAVNANQGYVYVRAEYPLAVSRLGTAIEQARAYGMLGKDIFGSGFDFDLEIRVGAGAFVCGEETALLASIEGRRGEPRPRPPFPAVEGLWRQPTLLNNVETFANIPQIILRGAAWYASLGTEKSRGTKVFALAGKIRNTGLVEVPMGIPLGEIVFDIGGGIPGGKKFKAAQTGGPSGGCIPASHLNAAVDYDSLVELGTIMGSGGLVIMDEDTCMVDLAKFFIEFCQDESCGKCSPCRIGTKRMFEILDRITKGQGREGDIELLEELSHQIRSSALCGLGQTAPNPVLSTIRYFRDEYVAHIRDRRCPASVCATLFDSPCQNTCPALVDVPIYLDQIRQGRYRDAYLTVRQANPLPVICGRVCDHPCESKCRRQQLDEALAIRSLKRFAGDWILANQGQFPLPAPARRRDAKVAIIGSGPAGLTAAYYLAQGGYDVTVFEALSVTGGLLAVGIPEYRLPKQVLRSELSTLEELGVKFVTNTRLGREITVDGLRAQGYAAVLLAVGAHADQKLGIPGEELEGVTSSLEFLRRVNLERDMRLAGRRVAVIGGGNAAIDAARSALRLGAREVTIVYRRRQEDMPAIKQEVTDAMTEGVKFIFLANPVSCSGNGRLESMRVQRMQLGNFDASGRRRPVPVEEYLELPVDLVITAVGQAVEADSLQGAPQVRRSRSGTVVAGEMTLQTNVDGVFAAGDCVTGASTVIGAIAQGKQAARSIHRYLGGTEDLLEAAEPVRVATGPIIEETLPRQSMPTLAASRRTRNFSEVELGFDEERAVAEATRCLRCDIKEQP